MPALDYCHAHVVHALQKDNWEVSPVSPIYSALERTVYIDVRATRSTNGVIQQRLLAEVKCFPTQTTRELYAAIGQYLIYRAILEEINMSTPLYLAVPSIAFYQLFDGIVQRVIRETLIKLVVVDLTTETIVKWSE